MEKTNAGKGMEKCGDVQSIYLLASSASQQRHLRSELETNKGGTNTTFPRVRDTNNRAF